EYIIGKLRLPDKKALASVDTSTYFSLQRQLEREIDKKEISFTLDCLNALNKSRNPNISVKFGYKEENVLLVETGRIFIEPKHSFGLTHLFFFNDQNEIERVFYSNWIE